MIASDVPGWNSEFVIREEDHLGLDMGEAEIALISRSRR